jgi:hypothetical protein
MRRSKRLINHGRLSEEVLMARTRNPRKQKPLFVIKAPARAAVYRATFRPFTATKLLDLKKLKTIRKVSLEVGTIEAGDRKGTLVLDIQKGLITGVSVLTCGCEGRSKVPLARRKAAMREIARRVSELPEISALPVPIARQSGGGTFRFPFPWGPIIIIWEPHDDGSWCVGVKILERDSLLFCIYCSDIGFIQCF